MPDYKQRRLALADSLKQIITLSSGAIVLIATLLDKLGRAPNVRWTVKSALVCFVLSTIPALVAMATISLIAHDDDMNFEGKWWGVIVVSLFLSPISLVVGLTSLVVFVCNNF